MGEERGGFADGAKVDVVIDGVRVGAGSKGEEGAAEAV